LVGHFLCGGIEVRSLLSVAGIIVLGMSVWYDSKLLPQDSPIPLAWGLLVYGVILITSEIVGEDL